jgi:hypothetical protein
LCFNSSLLPDTDDTPWNFHLVKNADDSASSRPGGISVQNKNYQFQNILDWMGCVTFVDGDFTSNISFES